MVVGIVRFRDMHVWDDGYVATGELAQDQY